MNQKGFTLIETLIYIVIIGLVLATMSAFALNLIETRAKVQASSKVIQNARLIQDRLTDAARHAGAINTGSSTFGSDPGVLSFDMADAAEDPMIFSLTADDGQFQINTAGGGNVPLTTTDVQITNLQFTNLTSSEDIGVVKAEFTVQVVNESNRPFFSYVETFQTTLRIPLD